MSRYRLPVVVILLVAAFTCGITQAVTIETVPVGNAGNAGELSGAGAGGYGPDRICGSVVYTYNIGKHEVTAGQYTAFLNSVAKTDTYGLYNTNMWSNSLGCKIQRSGTPGSYTYSVAADGANRPVNYVSYWDSCRFANWLNNGQPTGAQGSATTEHGTYTLDGYNGNDGRTIQRNPGSTWAVTSEDEWYKAAYHKNDGVTGNYWDYPTRSNTAPGRDMVDASGNNANYYPYPVSGPYPIDSPYYTTVVGDFQNSESPYGTFDQGGNVWEWNESVVYEGSDWSSRGLRGGSFGDEVDVLHVSFRIGDIPPAYENGLVGFRVSEVPEPATLFLLAIGVLMASRRKR